MVMKSWHIFLKWSFPTHKPYDRFALRDTFTLTQLGNTMRVAADIAAKIAGTSPLEGMTRGHIIASQVVAAKGSIVDIDISKLD